MMIIDPGETILRDRGLSYVATNVINHVALTGTYVNIPFPFAFRFQDILT
jgi:hypothetical protein